MENLYPPHPPLSEDEIVCKVEIPPLNLCLDSKPPSIFSGQSFQHSPHPPIFEQTESKTITTHRHAPRSLYQKSEPTVPPGQIPYTGRPSRDSIHKKLKESQLLAQIKRENDFLSHLKDKLSLYKMNHEGKIYQFSQDYEEHYYRPIQQRIKNQMNNEQVQARRNERERLIQSMDKNPISIRSNQPLPELPAVRVDISDLQDPHLRYLFHQKQEESLSRYVLKANGQYTQKPKRPGRKTYNANDYKLLQEVRFFDGKNPENPIGPLVGKKFFDAKTDSSRTSNCFNYFG